MRREDERGHTLASASQEGRGSVSWLLQVQQALPGGTATKGPEHKIFKKESKELVQVIRNFNLLQGNKQRRDAELLLFSYASSKHSVAAVSER